MMKTATMFVLAILSAIIYPVLTSHPTHLKQETFEPKFDGQWSESVNGLRARFRFSRNDSGKGAVRIEPYIELHNSSDVLGNIDIAINKSEIKYGLTNKDNKDVPKGMVLYSGLVVDFGLVRVPHDSFLSLNVTGTGSMISKETACHIDLGPEYCWAFKKGDTDDCFLSGRILVKGDDTKTWTGEISIPKAKIPLQPNGG